jgi:hypothetical protein
MVLRKPHIAAELLANLQNRCAVTQTRIVDELARIGVSDITEVATWRNEVEVQHVKEAGEEKRGLNSFAPRHCMRSSDTGAGADRGRR